MAEESTTPDLVELVRQSFEAGNSREFDAIMSIYAPDAVWDMSLAGLGLFEGAAAIRSFFEEWIGSYVEYENKLEENRDLGNGFVFTVARLDASPVDGPGRVQERWAFTSIWAAGVIVRVTARNDIDEARAAAERLAEERAQDHVEESTTPDPVELVDGAFEAVNRSDLDALMRFYAPDAFVDMTRTVGVGLQGRAAIRGVVEDWMAAYEEMEWTHDAALDLGNGVLFAVVRQKGRPVGTTGYVQQQEGWVWTWVEGLIVSHTIYQDIDEARAAAERLAEERADA